MTHQKVLVILQLILVSNFFSDATEVATSGSGKAIYTSSRNPISTYFKEHKNKLRPHFDQQSSEEKTSSLYSQGISVIDETSASGQPSPSYSHSNYYDSASPYDNNDYQSASLTPTHKESNYAAADLYDSSNPEYSASNAVYSVADPNGYPGSGGSAGTNAGYYGLSGTYNRPQAPAPTSSNIGYYGAPAESSYYDKPVYPAPTNSNKGPSSAGHADTSNYGESAGSPISSSDHHHGSHAPTRGSGEDDILSETGFLYDYNTNTDDDDMVMDIPLSGLLGGGGGGGDTAAPPAPADTAAPPDNPLSFLNLVGTDFQPGRLVNIFFGLFIMLFMIITHGYALWILGIAYLPGTRSLDNWEIDMNKLEGLCDTILDAIEYWEDKV